MDKNTIKPKPINMATPKRKKMYPHNLGRLMFKYLRGELTPLQEKTLTTWRNLSEANEKLFQEAIDPEKIRKELKILYESQEWRKIQQKYPELPRISKN
jgi:hypothetical protein